MRTNNHRPSGTMCKGCERLNINTCANLPFHEMPVMKKDQDGMLVVKCTRFERRPPDDYASIETMDELDEQRNGRKSGIFPMLRIVSNPSDGRQPDAISVILDRAVNANDEGNQTDSATWPEDVADWPHDPTIIQGGLAKQCKCRRLGDYGSEGYGHHPLCDDYVSVRDGANREQIKSLALRAGFTERQQPDGRADLNPYVYVFAAMIQAAEREACLDECTTAKNYAQIVLPNMSYLDGRDAGIRDCERRIRERGKK